MDTIIDIRKRIHEFIDQADEKMLRVFTELISFKNTEEEPNIPQSFYEELDMRRERHLKGESKSYTWEEVKNQARASAK